MLTLRAAPQHRWVDRYPAPPDEDVVRALVTALRLPPYICRLLAQRGYGSEAAAKRYLRPRLDQLSDPAILAGIDEAVARLEHALRHNETILVHGDYDVDGICATALYVRFLRRLGGRAEPFVPNRMADGYDLGPAGVAAAAAHGAGLILTGDCGIVAHDAIEAAARAGIDVIVTDHHTPGASLPPALAVVNPNRLDCGSTEKFLCGTGVAFKVCQALAARRGLPPESLWEYLDLVALATVADLVPLSGENRILVRYGLRQMRATTNPGLRALLAVAGVNTGSELAAGQLSHVLAPRINAVGRMSEALWGVRLLLEEDPVRAEEIARRLEEENRIRQGVDRDTLRQAMEMLERDFDPDRDYGVVLAGEGWHPGVIGIVASRVVEQIHRPTVLIALNPDGRARGSARSIPGFHLYDALHACAPLLERFGGHKHAAGMDILPENVDALRAAFNAEAHARLTPEDLIPDIAIDLHVSLCDAGAEMLRWLRHFGPYGMGNPSPVLAVHGVTLAGAPRVVGEGHAKLMLAQEGAQLPAIGFRMAERMRELHAASRFDVAFQLAENTWNGRTELQARLCDIRAAE